MKLKLVAIYRDRSVIFYYQDINLFEGHSITIYLDPQENLEFTEIEA